jgi:hypothetical protein
VSGTKLTADKLTNQKITFYFYVKALSFRDASISKIHLACLQTWGGKYEKLWIGCYELYFNAIGMRK